MAKLNESEREEHVRRVVSNSREPEINTMDYDLSMIHYSNFHNIHTPDKDRRAWLLSSLTKNEELKLLPIIEKATDFEIRQISILKRAKDKGAPLSDNHILFIDRELEKLRLKYRDLPALEKPEIMTRVNQDDKYRNALLVILNDIESELEKFVSTGSSSFSMKQYLDANNVSQQLAKIIPTFFDRNLAELRLALSGEEKQLVEGYSNFKRVELRHFAELIESIILDCQTCSVSKKPRATRTQKPILPIKLIKNLKYLKVFDQLNLKSIDPKEIIGCQYLWIYDTTNRLFGVYKSADKTGLTVHGTKIKNFDTKFSIMKTIRQPDGLFSNLIYAKNSLSDKLNQNSSKPKPMNGSISANVILLKAFK